MRFKFVSLLLAAPLVASACDVLIGLNKYCGEDCSDAATLSEAGGDAITDAQADGGSDVVEIPDALDEATSWARWRIENPLPEIQVEAGASATSLATFVDASSSAAVIDQVTKLTWSTLPSVANTIEAAAAYCASLTPSGFRVPTRIELVTLLDTTRNQAPFIEAPFVQPLITANAAAGNLWTASYYRPIQGTGLTYWFVNVTTGEVYQSQGTQAGVICVH